MRTITSTVLIYRKVNIIRSQNILMALATLGAIGATSWYYMFFIWLNLSILTHKDNIRTGIASAPWPFPCSHALTLLFDICLSADEDIDSTYPANIVVHSNGDMLWVPPGLFLSTCKIDITWFPFDDQKCTMKFGSWTYTSDGIDLQLSSDEGDASDFIPNGEWKLIGKLFFKCQYDPLKILF